MPSSGTRWSNLKCAGQMNPARPQYSLWTQQPPHICNDLENYFFANANTLPSLKYEEGLLFGPDINKLAKEII